MSYSYSVMASLPFLPHKIPSAAAGFLLGNHHLIILRKVMSDLWIAPISLFWGEEGLLNVRTLLSVLQHWHQHLHQMSRSVFVHRSWTSDVYMSEKTHGSLSLLIISNQYFSVRVWLFCGFSENRNKKNITISVEWFQTSNNLHRQRSNT